jgi:CheY-like chemotaxis protein
MSDILMAEDNPADAYLVREALREHGIDLNLRVATDGKEVLELLCGNSPTDSIDVPELIILDLNLPCHDGIEILQQVRATGSLDAVPVVILTSSDSPRDRKMATDLGATLYLRKPSSLEQFLALGAIFKDLLNQHMLNKEPAPYER